VGYYTEPKIEKTSANVLTVRFDEVAAGWEQWLMLSSDRHHDSPTCNRELERKQLEKAVERQALIIDDGDLFDVMQGKFDPRRSYSGLRPEYKQDTYLDSIVAEGAKFYGPYAKRFLMIGRGNHDQAIIKNNGTDLISNLVSRLNTDWGGNVAAGGYGGWVRFMFKVQKTMQTSIKLKYFHGAGGGGPVTRGTIQTNRQAVYLPDADIVCNGHTHDAWVMPISRERISQAGKVYQDLVTFVRTPTYNDDYRDGADGWHVERWGAPKPRGCVWARLYYEDGKIKVDATLDII
jgi:predicted phosphodiesterase